MTQLMESNEVLAREVGQSKKFLRQRLREAMNTLDKEFRKKNFADPSFDADLKRLIGDHGYYLQWLIRPDPKSPPSYDNQQTSRGTVELRRNR